MTTDFTKEGRKDRTASLDILPQELADNIVTHLEDDIPALISCSLVCRKLSSDIGRSLLFKRCSLSAPHSCKELLDLPESILQHIKILDVEIFPLSSCPNLLNHPSFHRVMATLGPLDLTLNSLYWSKLNDNARQVLSAHSFRRIRIEYSSFHGLADICSFLRSSHDLETLILPTIEIADTSMPHRPYQMGPPVTHLTVNSDESRLKLFEFIVRAPSCPISVSKLRVLDVYVSHAEELGLLREVLAMTKELQELKVSHAFCRPISKPLPSADLNLASVKSLTVEMYDFPLSVRNPILFQWWCEVLANTRATRINKLDIQSLVDWTGAYKLDTTLWSQVARALSKPSWETLSTLRIVIYAQNRRSVTALLRASYIEKVEGVMAVLTRTRAVEVSVTLKNPGPECDSEPEEE